jgi:tetratricopeptide (TPR) repeat protein
MPRNLKIALAACVTLFLIVAGYAIYQQENYEASFVKEINRNLSPEDRKIYEDRIAEADRKLAEAQSDTERYNLLMQKGFNLYGLGSLTAAKDVFNQANELNPNDSTALVALYQTQVDMNDPKGALKSIQAALKLKENDPDIWKKYIVLQEEKFNLGNDRISALYSEALVKTNTHINMVTAYAVWLEKVGNLQSSKEYWQKAIELNPNNKATYEAEIKRIDQKMQQAS